MTTKYTRQGDSILYSNSGSAIASNAVVIVGNLICVALEDIAANGTGWLGISGAFKLPKASAAVIAQGENVIWDVSAGDLDDDQATPATGDISKGAVALEAAGNGTTEVEVLLMPGSGVVA